VGDFSFFGGDDFSVPSMDYSLPDLPTYDDSAMAGIRDQGLTTDQLGGGSSNPFGNMSWGQMLGGGLGLGTAGLGIAGVLQQMLASQQQPMTAQQRASMNQGLQSMGTAQGAGSSLLGAMQGLQPMQMQAAGQGLQGQMGLLNQFQPWMNALAQGNLPLSPQIQSLVDQAYAPSFGSAFQQASQAGQARGFYDNPATGPVGGNVLGQMLPQLAGQEAQAKLNLGMQMPGVIGQAVNNYSPLTQAFGQASQGQGNIMNALTGASGVGDLASMRTKPPNTNLLQSMNQMGPVLGGLGGLLTGISGLSGMSQQRPQY
jgi:hypothetical protein